MSQKELNRLQVVQKVEEGRLSQMAAARELGLGTRQVRRLQAGFRAHGASGLVSRRRGRPSNRRLSAEVQNEALRLLRSRYQGFGPTLACEKLREQHGLDLSVESLRQLMIRAGLWHPRKKRGSKPHPRRMQRLRRGELVQIDGSPHDWFEGRAPVCSLLVFIDDATKELQYLRFVGAESTESYLRAFRAYLQREGRPQAVYTDGHSAFRVNREEPADTQIGRALRTLDIDLIHAYSPQAKGRVERANQTLQDRLVKEMRLRKICSWDDGNAFLEEFRADFNRRFAVKPQDPEDAHRPLACSAEQLDRILCWQYARKISKNLEVQFANQVYQIQHTGPCYAMQGAMATVYRLLSGEVLLRYKQRELPYCVLGREAWQQERVDAKELNARLERAKPAKPRWRPPADHPWRRPFLGNSSRGKSAPSAAS